MFAEERKQRIVEIINQKKKVTVNELSELFGTSSGTIRNDLTELESLDLLRRTHGGAIINTQTGYERKTVEKAVHRQFEKIAVARQALHHIEDGDTIAIDTGTTTLELARLLTSKHNLTVVTNDLLIALVLEEHPDITVQLVGGRVRKDFHCLVGPSASDFLAGLRVDKTFLAANGISPQAGISTPDIDTAQVKKEYIKIAEEVILLCDNSKFGRASFIRFAEVADIDLLITDTKAPMDRIGILREAGLNIEFADLENQPGSDR
jgi:DeoR family fructose operon transcriptional repressor